MTERLEEAFAEASKLPKEEQDALARWLLEELASERRWGQALSASQDRVAELADGALDEYRHGETRRLDPGEL
jgi:hypothetical protein